MNEVRTALFPVEAAPEGSGRRKRIPLVTTEGVAEAAYRLLRQDGPEGLSMRKLAGALHVSLPTVYTAIGSRERLVAGLQHRLLAEISADLYADDRVTAAVAEGDRQLETLAAAFLAWSRANPRLAEFLADEPLSPEVARAFVQPAAAVPEAVAFLVGVFRELHRDGTLAAVEPVVGLTFAVAQLRTVLALMNNPAFATLETATWNALAASTVQAGITALGR